MKVKNFDMQSPNTQAFPNFMDPRMSGYDPRSRPNFDPNGMMPPGMDSYGNNSGFSSKMRMNEMAAMFNNPAALAAMQRQRMSSMFTQGRDNVSLLIFNHLSIFSQKLHSYNDSWSL